MLALTKTYTALIDRNLVLIFNFIILYLFIADCDILSLFQTSFRLDNDCVTTNNISQFIISFVLCYEIIL